MMSLAEELAASSPTCRAARAIDDVLDAQRLAAQDLDDSKVRRIGEG
jgi:hypothetical protein